MADLAGRTLGKYQLQARLGRGGMAEVYRAHQPGLERLVALKVLHPHIADDPDFIARFRREAQAVAQLRHPHIVQVFDFDAEGDLHYMVMEYVEGPTLKEVLDEHFTRGESLPVPEVLRLFRALLEAVGYAHERSLIHRDIKPANVMLDPAGRPVLTDFGIVKMIGGAQLTATGVGLGTPAYMSPEQGLGGSGDARSDLYALGVMFYEMLAGTAPYEGDSSLAIMYQHVNAPIPSLHQARPDLPDSFDRLIATALAKSPDARFQSAYEMLAALDALSDASEKTTGVRASLFPRRKKSAARAGVAASATARPGETRLFGLPRPILLAAGSALLLILLLAGRFVPGWLNAPSPAAQLIADGGAQLATGNYQLAADAFTSALKVEPNNVMALLGRAQAQEQLGQVSDALADVEQAITLAPENPLGYEERARLNVQYGLSDDPAVVLADLDQALQLAPDSARAYFRRGWAILNFPLIGDAPNPQAALDDLQKAVALDPKHAEAQFTLARAFLTANRPAEALVPANRAVELDPQLSAYRRLRAHIQAALGDFHAAIDDLTAAIDREPAPKPQAALHAERAYLHHRLGEAASAQADIDEAMSLDAASKPAQYVLLLLDPALPRPSHDEIAQAADDAPDDPIWQAIVAELAEAP